MKRRIAGMLLGISVSACFLAGCGKETATETVNENTRTEMTGNAEDEDLAAALEKMTDEEEVEEEPMEETEKVSVGVLLPEGDSKDGKANAEALLSCLEAEACEVFLRYADLDAETQMRQLSELLSEGVTSFILDPVDSYALEKWLAASEETTEENFFLISYDVLCMNTDQVGYYATFDFRESGNQAAERVVKDFELEKWEAGQEAYSVEFLMGSLDDLGALFFFNGVMEKLQPYLDSGALVCRSGKVAFQDTGILRRSEELAEERMEKLMEGYAPQEAPDIVMTGFDSAVYAVQRVLEKKEILPGSEEWPYLTGVGCEAEAVRDIAEGKVKFSVFYDRTDLAEKAAGILHSHLQGETPEAERMDLYDNGVKIVGTNLSKGILIDGDNYETLVEKGIYQASEIEPLEPFRGVQEEPGEGESGEEEPGEEETTVTTEAEEPAEIKQ